MTEHDNQRSTAVDGTGIPGVALAVPAGFEPVAGPEGEPDSTVLVDKRWLRRDGLYLAVTVTEADHKRVAVVDESLAGTLGRYHEEYEAEVEGVIPLTVAGAIGARGSRSVITNDKGARRRLIIVAALMPDYRVVTVQAVWPDGVDLLDEAAAIVGSLTIG